MKGAATINTEPLRIFLQSQIERVCPASYEEARERELFPYAVWFIDFTNATESRADGLLEINLWDKSKSGTRVDRLADRMWKQFNRMSHTAMDFHVLIHASRRQTVPDEDKDLRRRRMQFEVHYTKGR